MSEKKDKCNISYIEDNVTGWKLRLEGKCDDIVEKVNDLPASKRRYLERRLLVK
jgi:hypothetical protein